MRKKLKEKVQTAPKELARRGLVDGVERLRGQLRDTAQGGQTDRYGGDQIENAAAGGVRQAEHGVERLLGKGKKKRGVPRADAAPNEPPAPAEDTPARPSAEQRPRIKTREAARSPSAAPAQDRPAQAASKPAIKTKGAYLQREAVSPVESSAQGGRAFAQERGRIAARDRAQQRRKPESVSTPQSDHSSVPTGKAGRKAGRSSYAPSRPSSASGPSTRRAVQERTGPGRGLSALNRGPHPPRGAVKTAEHTSRQVIKTADQAAKTAGRAARSAPRTMRAAVGLTRHTAQAVRAAARTAAVTAKATARAAVAAAKAAIAAAQALISAIGAGGGVVLALVVVVCLVGVLIVSPFGIFFAEGGNAPDAASPATAVAQINRELTDRLEELQAGGTYDSVEVQGQPPGWPEVLAVFAARTAGAEDGVDVAVLDPERVELLRTVFWDMTKITTEEKPVEHPASGDTPAWTETILIITITPRTPDDMRVFYQFTDGQNKALDELLANRELLATLAGDLSISQADAVELLRNLPSDLDSERRAVVETACKLVGKVNYFWGGKSLTLGWDNRWGTLRQVTAAGSSTTGTYRPYGLDCSGFVDWVIYNMTDGEYVIGHGGGAHAQHTYCDSISWDEALPGDLVFYPGDEHVGIVGGWDENGDLLIVHCASGANNVVITGVDGFTSIGRPIYYGGT